LNLRELFSQKIGQFSGMFLWTNLVWMVIRTYDSKLIQNPEKFNLIENIPPKWRELQHVRDMLRVKCRRDKPQSYLFDIVVFTIAWHFIQNLMIKLLPGLSLITPDS